MRCSWHSIGLTLLRLPASTIAVGAAGGPMLFLLYLREADAFRDLPVRIVLLASLIGVGLGVVWALVTGEVVARSYGIPLEAGTERHAPAAHGIGHPAGHRGADAGVRGDRPAVAHADAGIVGRDT